MRLIRPWPLFLRFAIRLLIIFSVLYGLYFVHSSIGWRICYSQLTYVSDQDYFRYLFEYIYDNNHRELIVRERRDLMKDEHKAMVVTEITDGSRSVFVGHGIRRTSAFWTGPMELIANTIRGAEIMRLIDYRDGKWEGGVPSYVFEPCGNLATILN